MTSKTLIYLVCASLLISFPAFGNDWNQVLDRLQQQGVQQVGDLHLGQLESEIRENVQWKEIDKDSRPLFAGTRRSAFYVIKDKTVYKNKDLPSSLKQIQPQLDLHEALGALGYQDQAYSLSTSLDLISRARDAKSRQYLIDNIGPNVFSKENLQRLKSLDLKSGPGEGGGGDITAMLIKSAVLTKILSHPHVNSKEVLKHYPFINFEPQYNPKEQFVAIKFEFRDGKRENNPFLEGVPVQPGNGNQEKLSVWVPVLNWNSSKANRTKLIDEVTNKILELFPFQAITSLPTATYRVCNNQAVTYLKPSSSIVRKMQFVRAQLFAGCGFVEVSPSTYQVGATGFVFPAIDENFRLHYESPFYTCKVWRNGKLRAKIDFNELKPTTDALAEYWHPVGDYVLAGTTAIVKRNKNLEIIEFGFIESDSYHIEDRSNVVSFRGSEQSYEMVQNGDNFRIQCYRHQ